MNKLLKLKEWLTIPDTACHLSGVCGEPVTEADVLRLALEGHLKLSVYFVNHARARIGNVVPIERALVKFFPEEFGASPVRSVRRPDPLPPDLQQDFDQDKVFGVVHGIALDSPPTRILELAKEISTIHGVWDLPMIGAERLDVEHAFQQLTGGPEVTLVMLDGTFIESPDGTLAQLQERFDSPEMAKMKDEVAEQLRALGAKIRPANERPKLSYDDPNNYYPRGGLPPDAPLVVRTSALTAFQSKLSDEVDVEKPLGTRERGTLLTIIKALAKEARIDIGMVSKAAERIERIAAALGDPVAARTIENHLRKIRDR